MFAGPNELEAFEIAPENPYFSVKNGNLYSKDGKTLYSVASKNTQPVILDGVSLIYDRAFEFTDIESIVLPESITNISAYAFNNCFSLKRVEFLNPDCKLSADLQFGQGYAFNGCTALTEVVLPSNLKEIPYGTFQDCCSLYEIDLPETLETIGDAAFANAGLVHVNLPSSLKTIGVVAFYCCPRLLDVDNRSGLSEEQLRGEFRCALTFNGNEDTYSVSGDFVFVSDETGSTLAAYVGKDKEVHLPSSFRGRSYNALAETFYYFDWLGGIVSDMSLYRSTRFDTHHPFSQVEKIYSPINLKNVVLPKNAEAIYEV